MEDLKAALKRAEDNFVERKPAGVHPRDIRRTLVAFANSVPDGRRGILFIGVADDGSTLGVESVDALQKSIRVICSEQCYPPIEFSTEVLYDEVGAVVAVIVPPSQKRPHFAGPAYVRRGAASEIATAEEYEKLLLSRHDRCRVILGWGRNAIIVYGRGKRVGDLKRLNDSRYLEAVECQVESCDEHVLRLVTLNGQHLAEPMKNVSVMYDEKRHRHAIVVEESS